MATGLCNIIMLIGYARVSKLDGHDPVVI